MNVYREPAEKPLPYLLVREPAPIGLLRANGSCCTCRPPGWLWSWWHDCQQGDRWYCKHGGGWLCTVNSYDGSLRWREETDTKGDG